MTRVFDPGGSGGYVVPSRRQLYPQRTVDIELCRL